MYGQQGVTLDILRQNRVVWPYFTTWRQWLIVSQSALISNRIAAENKLIEIKSLVSGGRRNPARPISGESVYRPEGFNQRGDMTAHLGLPGNLARVMEQIVPIPGELNEDAFSCVRKLGHTIEDRGGRFLMLYPGIPQSYWNLNRKAIQVVAGKLPAKWVRTVPSDWVFEDVAFFDTLYHLGSTGRLRRTERVLAEVIGMPTPGSQGNTQH